MDKLYEQLNQNLPSILQGATITKEYFHDLFNRYTTYLIISDTIQATFFFLVTIALFFFTVKYHKKIMSYLDDSDILEFYIIAYFLLAALFIILTLESVNTIIKDLTIPEIRIYEQFTKE